MINRFFIKKSAVIFFLILIVFSALPTSAFAAATTAFEVNPLVWVYNIITSQQSVLNTAANIGSRAQQLLEWAFRIAVEALKRQLLNMIVDQIVVWIQGGGEPKFITDWPGFFRDAIDAAGGQFIQELGAGALCSPYRLSLRAAFIPIPRFSDRSACTLSQVGVNLENFLADFNRGGWIAWNEMILKPQNNIYGAYLMAWDEYERRKSAAQKAAESEAYAGQGFLSVKRCAVSHVESFDEDGEPVVPYTVCDREEVVTPGKVVGELAGKAIGSDIDYIVNAQDFAAYVAAITNAILNRVFAEGIGLLHSAVSSSGGGGPGGTPGGNAQAQCAPFLGTAGYTQCVNSIQSGQNILVFQQNQLIQTIDEDLPFQNQLLGAKQTTLTILNQSLDTIRQIEACRHSTHPDAIRIQGDINTIANQISLIQSDIIALQLIREQIRTVTDITQIPALYVQVANLVIPSATQAVALAAQEEAIRVQTNLTTYQQQLNACIQSNPPQPTPTGNIITASPNPCSIAQGATTCTSNISWSTTNVSRAQVWRMINGASEALFGDATSFTAPAPWITASPDFYDFNLYDYSTGSRGALLATKRVTGTAQSFSTAVPALPSGLNQSCSADGNSCTLTWSSVAGATRYALRVDDQANAFATDANNTARGGCASTQNAGDFCDYLTSTVHIHTTTPGHTYSWWVHACNDAGCSSHTNGTQFTQ